MAKLTLSLSQSARNRIDVKAAELGVTRSAFVEGLVAADADAELERQLEEGYRATAADNLAFAERAIHLAWETLQDDDSSW